ncbi:MAG: proteasome accessory factor PafA2 family protein, partial [bacterium]|nr:proteasome accessory factor PafA2 family protein [bacterium]
MHFPERVYGTENEHGITRIFPDGTFNGINDSMPNYMPSIAIKWIPQSVHCYAPGHPRIWHSNGGSTYVDTGYHPEHSTPECRSIRDAVRYNKAGEFLIAQVFDEPMSPIGKLLLFKNNIGLNEEGQPCGEFGAHENYMVYTSQIRDTKKGPWLIPFLITRQIMDGAGLWSHGGYSFSQRAHAITKEFGSGTTSDRPLINTKSTADTGNQERLHLILGDANILEFATYLKIGTTALVLNLIEGRQVPQIICASSVEDMKEVCAHYDALEPLVELLHADGTKDKKSAYETQVIYLEAAQRELASGSFDSEETEAELKHVALCWEQTLNAI